MGIARDELARVGAQIWRRDIVGIADFGLHSAHKRFHFVDLENERVASYHVSHGTGSDGEHDGWLKRYSNIEGARLQGRGAFMTRSWYVGRYGTSIRLDGLDATNSNAAAPRHRHAPGELRHARTCRPLGPPRPLERLFRHGARAVRSRTDRPVGWARLLVSGSYGIAEDGSTVTPPVAQYDLLRREDGTTFSRTNPWVFDACQVVWRSSTISTASSLVSRARSRWRGASSAASTGASRP